MKLPRFSIRHILAITALIAVEMALLVAVSRRTTIGVGSVYWMAVPWLLASGYTGAAIYFASKRISFGAAICLGVAMVTFVESTLIIVWLLSVPHHSSLLPS